MSEGLRRRGQAASHSNDDDEMSKNKRGLSLESFDLYQKVQSEESVQTNTGAGISIVSYLVIAFLVISELYTYFVPKVQEHMLVDPVLEGRLRINFDITFPALHCGEVNLDAMDVAGEQQNGIDHDMSKSRLGPDGLSIGASFAARLKSKNDTEFVPEALPADYCGSCFGAAMREGQCCNTCNDLRQVYNEKGWDSTDVLRDSEQCKRDALNPDGASRPGEGCRLAGVMTVNKVAGNFHIAMGETHTRGAGHIHQFNPAQILQYNVTHTIHKLSFGQELVTQSAGSSKSYGAKGPLDGVSMAPPEGAGVFMYYIKVIPTVIARGEGPNMTTNQYSVTRQYRPAVHNGQRQNVLPGVFFVYDVSPFMVLVTSHTAPLASVITNLCAILGGVIAAATLVDQVLYRLTRAVKVIGKGELAGPPTGGAQGALADALAGAVTHVQQAAVQYASPKYGYGGYPSSGTAARPGGSGFASPTMVHQGQGQHAQGTSASYTSAHQTSPSQAAYPIPGSVSVHATGQGAQVHTYGHGELRDEQQQQNAGYSSGEAMAYSQGGRVGQGYYETADHGAGGKIA